jgi:hypothetical protein
MHYKHARLVSYDMEHIFSQYKLHFIWINWIKLKIALDSYIAYYKNGTDAPTSAG